MSVDSLDKIVSLCKRRGFIYPGSEIYGGLANSWDYGPLGVELKNNIKQLWWRRFVQQRDDIVGIDAAIVMNPKVWVASGHLKEFTDDLVECKNCHARFKSDVNVCKECDGKEFTAPRKFNLMFKTFLGPSEDTASTVYLRPETAQAMFVDYKNVLDSTRINVPFGIAQIGRAFRNEITPGNFIFRTREFEMMEIEYFINPNQWEKYFEHWRGEMISWIKELGINENNIYELEVPKEERAHYSKRTIDFEYDFPFGKEELYGLAYRSDFDLKNHQEQSGQNLEYTDQASSEKFIPHVIEPTWGVDRSFLAVLCEAYDDSNSERLVLHLKPQLAPHKVAVFPLVANKPELVEKAKEIYRQLKTNPYTLNPIWDDRGNIGKRYYSQDEIGTPWCVTVDHQSLEDNSVTVRDRDTTKQERVNIAALEDYFESKLKIIV